MSQLTRFRLHGQLVQCPRCQGEVFERTGRQLENGEWLFICDDCSWPIFVTYIKRRTAPIPTPDTGSPVQAPPSPAGNPSSRRTVPRPNENTVQDPGL
jgi:hypothetical protein